MGATLQVGPVVVMPSARMHAARSTAATSSSVRRSSAPIRERGPKQRALCVAPSECSRDCQSKATGLRGFQEAAATSAAGPAGGVLAFDSAPYRHPSM